MIMLKSIVIFSFNQLLTYIYLLCNFFNLINWNFVNFLMIEEIAVEIHLMEDKY